MRETTNFSPNLVKFFLTFNQFISWWWKMIRQSYNSWFKTPGLQDSGTPRLWDSKTPGLWDSRTPGLPNSKTPKLQDSQTPRLPDSHTESQCERLCIWGAPHIFQMKYFAIWVAKFRFWKLDRGQRLCWCAPGLWGWSVEEVHKFILVGRYWLISYLTCTTTSFNAINKHKYSHFIFMGGGGCVWGKVEIKVGRGQPLYHGTGWLKLSHNGCPRRWFFANCLHMMFSCVY